MSGLNRLSDSAVRIGTDLLQSRNQAGIALFDQHANGCLTDRFVFAGELGEWLAIAENSAGTADSSAAIAQACPKSKSNPTYADPHNGTTPTIRHSGELPLDKIHSWRRLSSVQPHVFALLEGALT